MNQTLLILGDTNIQGRQDPDSAFVHVKDTLAAADLLFGHLEGPLAEPSEDPARPDIPHKPGWRHSGARMASALRKAGYMGVSCASNVSHPASAAVRSVDVLDEVGIKHCGVGRTLAEARRPVILEHGSVRVGFLSYTSVFWPSDHAAGPQAPGCATIKAHAAYQANHRALEMPGAEPITRTYCDPAEMDAMREDVRQLRGQADIVILSCHWGVSSKDEPVDYQKEIAHAAIDAGADMVFGHHPHVVQGGEMYRGKPVFYSLGNFVFDWTVMRNRHLDGIALRCTLSGKAISVIELLPARRDAENDIRFEAAEGAAGRDILTRFEELSAKLGNTMTLAASGRVAIPTAMPTAQAA